MPTDAAIQLLWRDVERVPDSSQGAHGRPRLKPPPSDEPKSGVSNLMRDPREGKTCPDGSQASNNIWMQGGSEGLVVSDMRVRAKNSFLDVIPVENEASRQVGARRSASAPHAADLERSFDTNSSSSRNTAQKAMMNSSSSSGDSQLIVREPPRVPPFRVNDILQQPDSDDDDDSFAREHDGTTSFSDTGDTGDTHSSDFTPSPSDNPENEAPPPDAAGASSTNDENVWSLIPRDKNGQLTSIGSIKHATGNCEPCVFMRVGTSCKIGVHCARCHLSHRSKKPRPCKGKRDRQKKAIDRVLSIFDDNPADFDVHNFDVPSSIRSTSLEGQLRTELHRRDASLRTGHSGQGAASSSTDVPRASTRISL